MRAPQMHHRTLTLSHVVLACLLVLVVPYSTAQATTLVVDADTMLTAPAVFDTVLVLAGRTLTADSSLTVLNFMRVDSTASVQHSSRNTDGLQLEVLGTLNVKPHGRIVVDGLGLQGGRSGSIFGSFGEAFHPTFLDSIIPGAEGAPEPSGHSRAAGASFGGRGSPSDQGSLSNAPYGVLEDPQHLGSGGGAGEASNVWRAGDDGGGRISIAAGTFILNGLVSANGSPGSSGTGVWRGGGGSGGSIRVDVDTLTGSGAISASGGGAGAPNSTQAAGSGGGGRIAIYYQDMSSFDINRVTAPGGDNPINYRGAAGTIYLKNTAGQYGDLIIDGGGVVSSVTTTLLANETTFQSTTLRDRGRLEADSAGPSNFTVELPIELTNHSELILGSGVELLSANSSGFDVDVRSYSTLTLNPGAVFSPNAVRIENGKLNASIDMDFPVPADLLLTGVSADSSTITMLDASTLTVASFDGTSFDAGTVHITEGCRLDIATNSATIGNNVRIIKDGAFGPHQAPDEIETLLINGVVSHSSGFRDGLFLHVTGTLTVGATGTINVSALGLQGGQSGSRFGSFGETFLPTDLDSIVPGSGGGDVTRGAGASFAGWGAISDRAGVSANQPYGAIESPAQLGSGGGAGPKFASFAPGGDGGGRVHIIVDATMVLEGTVLANGGSGGFDGENRGGGGSGGSVRIDVGSLTGIGTVSANGGAASGNHNTRAAGSGGGGRIAIYYDVPPDPTLTFSAFGGNNARPFHGSAGTIYLKHRAESLGDLIIDNNGVLTQAAGAPLLTEILSSFKSVSVRNHGYLDISREIAIEGDLLVDTNGSLGRP